MHENVSATLDLECEQGPFGSKRKKGPFGLSFRMEFAEDLPEAEQYRLRAYNLMLNICAMCIVHLPEKTGRKIAQYCGFDRLTPAIDKSSSSVEIEALVERLRDWRLMVKQLVILVDNGEKELVNTLIELLNEFIELPEHPEHPFVLGVAEVDEKAKEYLSYFVKIAEAKAPSADMKKVYQIYARHKEREIVDLKRRLEIITGSIAGLIDIIDADDRGTQPDRELLLCKLSYFIYFIEADDIQNDPFKWAKAIESAKRWLELLIIRQSSRIATQANTAEPRAISGNTPAGAVNAASPNRGVNVSGVRAIEAAEKAEAS